MKNVLYILLIFVAFACQQKKKKLIIKSNLIDSITIDSILVNHKTDTSVQNVYLIPIKDSSKLIEPDIFLISDNDYVDSKKYPFFKCEKSNSNLFFVPYTDGSITTAILCREFNMPILYKELLKSEDLDFKITKPILLNKIQSINGININSKKKDFINLYGKPDSSIIKNNVEIMYWNLQIRESDSKIYDYRKLQPFLLNGLQFDIELHLNNNSIETLIYSYEVP